MFVQNHTGRVNSLFQKFTSTYRYGFNGKENDNEAEGLCNWQNYGMREYDTRVCRFISVDPLFKKYPELTTFQFASNTPIMGVDLDGKEIYVAIHWATTSNNSGHSFMVLSTYKEVISKVNGVEKKYYEKTGDLLFQVWPGKGAVMLPFSNFKNIVPTVAYKITSPVGVSGKDIGLDKNKTYYTEESTDLERKLYDEAKKIIANNKPYKEGEFDCTSVPVDLLNKIGYVSDPNFGKVKVAGENYATPNDLAKDLEEKKHEKPIIGDKEDYFNNLNRKNSKEYVKKEVKMD